MPARVTMTEKESQQPDTGAAPDIPFLAGMMVSALVALGIILRLSQYMFNRALWLDEAALALQIVYKSSAELIGPLSWHQNSPLGFLLSVKAITEVFGADDMTLRLLSITSGLLSVCLFAFLLHLIARRASAFEDGVRRYRWELLLSGLLIFVVSKHLIHYSSELRHYSTDIALVCLLYVCALWSLDDPVPRLYRNIIMLLIGIMATWVSLASIFILGAIAGTYTIFGLLQGRLSRLGWAVGLGLIWLASFLMHLSIHSHNIEVRGLGPEIVLHNAMSWAPFPPLSYQDLKWYREAFDFMFYIPVGLTYRGLGGFAFLAGCVALWKRDKRHLLLFTLPFAMTLFASALERYPFRDRYILFLAPCLIVVIAEGVGFLMNKRVLRTRLVGLALLVLLTLQPTLHAAKNFVHPRGGNEIRTLIDHMKTNWHEDDGAYMPLMTVPAFMVYLPHAEWDALSIPDELYYGRTELDFPGLAEGPLYLEPHVGTGENLIDDKPFLQRWQDEHLPELVQRSHSVWMILVHDSPSSIQTLAGETDAIGTLIEVVYEDGATLYRYQSTIIPQDPPQH